MTAGMPRAEVRAEEPEAEAAAEIPAEAKVRRAEQPVVQARMQHVAVEKVVEVQAQAEPVVAKPEPAVVVPCATSNVSDDEVWGAVLAAVEGKTALRALAGRLKLVSLSRLRAVIGYAPADKLAAEMALEKLPPVFEKVLGRPVRIVTQEIKEMEGAARVSPHASAEGGGGVADDQGVQGEGDGGGSGGAGRAVFSADAALADELVQQAKLALGPETRVVKVTPRGDL